MTTMDAAVATRIAFCLADEMPGLCPIRTAAVLTLRGALYYADPLTAADGWDGTTVPRHEGAPDLGMMRGHEFVLADGSVVIAVD